jgi:hypothetical protein
MSHAAPDIFAEFRHAVLIVTEARGREVYHSSRPLFRRLRELANQRTPLLQLHWRGERATAVDLRAFNFWLLHVGFRVFFRAARRRPGPERATATKYQWEYLVDGYLALQWEVA